MDTKGSSSDIEALIAENIQLKEDISGYDKEILGYKQNIEGSRKDLERIHEGYTQDITGYKDNIKALNLEIARMTESLTNAPEPSELAQLQASAKRTLRKFIIIIAAGSDFNQSEGYRGTGN